MLTGVALGKHMSAGVNGKEQRRYTGEPKLFYRKKKKINQINHVVKTHETPGWARIKEKHHSTRAPCARSWRGIKTTGHRRRKSDY